jgi:splicing factor 3B subunit 1
MISKQALLSKESSAAAKKRSRWDETPVGATPSGAQTPSFTPNANSITPSHGGSMYGDMTPVGGQVSYTPGGQTPAGMKAMNLQTPMIHMQQFVPQTPEQIQAQRWEREIDERNRPLTDEELDAMFPPGYKVC